MIRWWWWWRRQWWWRWRWRGWMAREMIMNDSWCESNVIYPRFHSFFVPAEGLLQGWHLSDSQNQKTCCFYTAKNLHREDFTHRSLCTERDLHRAAFTQTLLHRRFYIQKSRSFYTEKPFLKKPYHMKPLHRAALHTDVFSQRSFYTQELSRADAQAFTHRSFCAHTRTHTHAHLTKRSF